MNPRKIYEKFVDGDNLTNKELKEAQPFFEKMANNLSRCGPTFALAAKEMHRVAENMRLWTLNRGMTQKDELTPAIACLNDLAERWDETKEWHDPPFLEGRINITTGDLRAISIVCKTLNR